jgi:hypothetical protein
MFANLFSNRTMILAVSLAVDSPGVSAKTAAPDCWIACRSSVRLRMRWSRVSTIQFRAPQAVSQISSGVPKGKAMPACSKDALALRMLFRSTRD